MPAAEKLIEKMKRQPNGIRPEEAEKVLNAYGYYPVRQKGKPQALSEPRHRRGISEWKSKII